MPAPTNDKPSGQPRRWGAAAIVVLTFLTVVLQFHNEVVGFVGRMFDGPLVTILSPVDDDVAHSERLYGTYRNLASETELWALTLDKSGQRLHVAEQPCSLDETTEKYDCGDHFIGPEVGGAGGRFSIKIVMATPGAAKEFHRYHAEQRDSGDYPGLTELPDGATVVASKDVFRR